MKKSKINLLLITALLAVQATTHTKDEPKKEPRTWSQAAWDNRYGIAAGTAAVGIGALGYAYQNELMEIYSSMSPAKQEEMKSEVEKSIEQTEQVIEEKQEEIQKELDQVKKMNKSGKHSTAHNKHIAKKEEAIAEKQDEVAQLEQQVIKKAGFIGWITGQNSYQEYRNQVSRDIDEQAALDAARNAQPVSLDDEAIKNMYIAKYGNESGIQRYNQEKSANDYQARAAFATYIGSITAPHATGTIAVLAHTPVRYNPFLYLKPDYESANNYTHMQKQINNSEPKTQYASEKPENLSSDMRDDDEDRAQDKEYQRRSVEKERMKKPIRNNYEQGRIGLALHYNQEKFSNEKEARNLQSKIQEKIANKALGVGDIKESYTEIMQPAFTNLKELVNLSNQAHKDFSDLKSKYNDQFTASDDQVDRALNESSPRTWLSYANPLSPLRNNEPASNSSSPIDEQAAKDLEGLV